VQGRLIQNWIESNLQSDRRIMRFLFVISVSGGGHISLRARGSTHAWLVSPITETPESTSESKIMSIYWSVIRYSTVQ